MWNHLRKACHNTTKKHHHDDAHRTLLKLTYPKIYPDDCSLSFLTYRYGCPLMAFECKNIFYIFFVFWQNFISKLKCFYSGLHFFALYSFWNVLELIIFYWWDILLIIVITEYKFLIFLFLIMINVIIIESVFKVIILYNE